MEHMGLNGFFCPTKQFPQVVVSCLTFYFVATIFGEVIQFDSTSCFSDGLKPPTGLIPILLKRFDLEMPSLTNSSLTKILSQRFTGYGMFT